MAVVGLTNINHLYGDNCVLKDVSLSIENHHRCGLIGKNGTGKTTLLDIISGQIKPSEGQVFIGKKTNIAYLKQSFKIISNCDLLTYVLLSHKRVTELTDLMKKTESCLQQISCDNNDAHDQSLQLNMKLLDQYQAEYAALEGYSLEHRAKNILDRLSFTENDWYRQVTSFSGGEQTRIQLAGVLLAPADLILMDEPTNHLDIIMRDWLEKYLAELKIPYIIVSHDRYFLEKTTNIILSLENKNIVSYRGNYSFYEKEYRLKQKQLKAQYQAQQEHIGKTKYFIRKNIAGQKTKQAKSRLKALNKLDLIEEPETEKIIDLSIDSYKRSGNIVFTIDNLICGFPKKVLVQDFSTNVIYKDRIAVLGKNGCGKTTFLQTLAGEKKPLDGSISKGANISIGYYDQLHISLNPTIGVGETIKNVHQDWTINQLLSYLARFGFYEGDIDKRVALLSGGEKARLYLALLISKKPNVLIMDEPTNHLDIFMIKSLEYALKKYDGTIIFVSHDKYFINNIADRSWLFQDGHIKETHRWEQLLLEDATQNSKEQKHERQTKSYQKKDNNKKSNPLVLDLKLKKIERLENEIKHQNDLLNNLQNQFLKKDTFLNGNRVKILNLEIEKIKTEIVALEKDLTEKEIDYLEYLEL